MRGGVQMTKVQISDVQIDEIPTILGIESTCDETAIGIVQGRKILADVVASSMSEYARYGGIIPEIASRAHLESMQGVLTNALEQAGIAIKDLPKRINAIAVAAGPGLAGSLSVGVSAAKGLSLATGIPIYGVNHVIAHSAVTRLAFGEFPNKPFIALVTSGGHTSLLLVENFANSVRELGGTLDDAAGEAFDKVGRLLGLPYPGGPEIDKLARLGNPQAVDFPRALLKGPKAAAHKYDFSFSGVKTAVARYVEALERGSGNVSGTRGEGANGGNSINHQLKCDISASFAAATVEVLAKKTIQAAKDFGVDTVVVGGGFSANSQLREAFAALTTSTAKDIRVWIPPIKYCTDNGVMIASLGALLYQNKIPYSPIDFTIDSSMQIDKIVM
jgi:N6-L-threonylcarbamoyladenine synthase